LFKKSPQAKVLFGFPIDIDTDSREMLTSKRFLMHAAYLVQMIDTALNMLGPDIELLTEIMLELVAKPARYGVKAGVKAEMFQVMGVAIIDTLHATLKENFTEAMEDAWIETFEQLSGDMVRGMRQSKN
jgi:hemoglobin-like flavoprotein